MEMNPPNGNIELTSIQMRKSFGFETSSDSETIFLNLVGFHTVLFVVMAIVTKSCTVHTESNGDEALMMPPPSAFESPAELLQATQRRTRKSGIKLRRASSRRSGLRMKSRGRRQNSKRVSLKRRRSRRRRNAIVPAASAAQDSATLAAVTEDHQLETPAKRKRQSSSRH